MNIGGKRFTHLAPTHIRDSMQCETVMELIITDQILPDTVDDQMQQFMLLMQKQRHRKVPNLLFRIFVRRDQVDRFEVSKLHLIPLYVDV